MNTFCHDAAWKPVERMEIWVQMQVSLGSLINKKPINSIILQKPVFLQKQNNNQEWDNPDGNVVLVSRAHKTECNRYNKKTVNIHTQ